MVLYQETRPTKGVLMLLFQLLLSTSTAATTTNIFTRIYVLGTVLNAWPTGACASFMTRLWRMCCFDSFPQHGLAKLLQTVRALRVGLQGSVPQRPCGSPGHIRSSFWVLSAPNTLLTRALQLSMLQKVEYVRQVFSFNVWPSCLVSLHEELGRFTVVQSQEHTHRC